MSQILPDELDALLDSPTEDANAPAAFHDALQNRPPLEASHAVLTRTTWVRRTIEEALQGRAVETVLKPNGEIALVLDEALPRELLQYDLAPRAEYKRFELWGMSGKMQCPTWDLTAGPPSVGGTCPAASAGQSVCEPKVRRTMLREASSGSPRGADQQPVKALAQETQTAVGFRMRLDTVVSKGAALVTRTVKGRELIPQTSEEKKSCRPSSSGEIRDCHYELEFFDKAAAQRKGLPGPGPYMRVCGKTAGEPGRLFKVESPEAAKAITDRACCAKRGGERCEKLPEPSGFGLKRRK